METNNKDTKTDYKRCVAYFRASTEQQETQRQADEIKLYCNKHGYNLIKYFIENKSGRKRNREQMNECLKYIKENNIKTLILSEISRLSRGTEGGKIIDELTHNQIRIIALKEELITINDDGTPNHKDIWQAMGALSNAIRESDYLSHRVKSGKRSKVIHKNIWTGGKFLPYGYTSVNKVLTIDPIEKEYVKIIFEKYLSGWGAIKISNWLNAEKIPTKFNKEWSRSTINQMLPHRLYIGKRQYEGKELDVPQLRIIDDDLFYAVQKRMKERKNTDITFNQLRKYEYKFDKGLIRCGKCGKTYYGLVDKGKEEKGRYKCSSGKYSRGCGNETVNIRWLEFEVQRYIAVNQAKLIYDNTERIKQNKMLELDIKMLKEENLKYKAELNRLNELYIKNRLKLQEYDKRYNQITQNINNTIEKINTIQKEINFITPIKGKIFIKATAELVDEKNCKYEYTNFDIEKSTLHKIIKQITVYPCDLTTQTKLITVMLINGNSFNIELTPEEKEKIKKFK